MSLIDQCYAGTDNGDGICYKSMWEQFCGIDRPIDRYLVLRDLLKLAPRVYYELLLRHTEAILPFIYTVSTWTKCVVVCGLLTWPAANNGQS